MKIGLFFGSFNPIHNGHLIIAQSVLNETDLDRIWFVISPQNPFKEQQTLLPEKERLFLVKSAIEDNPKFKASDIEFKMPKPSYTIDTLVYLKEKYPQHQFALMMGGDNLSSFQKWKNYELILKNHVIYIYKRHGMKVKSELSDHKNIKILDSALISISSTMIRNMIKMKKNPRYLLPNSIYELVMGISFYKK